MQRYEEAITIYRQVGDRLGEANTSDSLALASFAEGQYQQAIDSHQQALEIFTLIESRYDIAWSFRYLGKTYLKLNDAWKAKEYFENAQTLFETLEMTESAQACQQQIQTLNTNTPLSHTPKIDDDRPSRPKTHWQSLSGREAFPLWQSAIVLLLLGIGWMAMRPHVPAGQQNGEVRMQK